MITPSGDDADEKKRANMNEPETKYADVIRAVKDIAESIRLAGSVPSGHLYAALNMPPMHQYQTLLDVLIRAGLIEIDRSHMITWIGPTIREQIDARNSH